MNGVKSTNMFDKNNISKMCELSTYLEHVVSEIGRLKQEGITINSFDIDVSKQFVPSDVEHIVKKFISEQLNIDLNDFEVKDNENIIAYTPYCGKFPSVINAGNVYGTQFHPEKSIPVGFKLLKNFLNL